MIGKPPVKLGAFHESATEPSLGVAISWVGAAARSVDITASEVLAPFPIVVTGVTRIQICCPVGNPPIVVVVVVVE